MPKAKEKSSEGLSIELSDNHAFYTPGSTISGNVTLITADDFAIGSVSLEFYGRVKVYFVQSHGQGESIWRGRAPLFSQTELLYEGYHTHKPGSFSWPFAVELPKNPDIAAIRQSQHQWDHREHFLSTNDYIPSHAMPPTFGFRKWGFGYRFHAFVEYVIKVSVKEAPGASMLPSFARKATLPILVRGVTSPEEGPVSLPCSIQFTLPKQLNEKTKLDHPAALQQVFKTQTITETFRSSKLLTQKSKPFSFSNTIRDKAVSVVNPDSLPRFTFNVTVSTPESGRLLDTNGISFFVDVRPVKDNAVTTIADHFYPDVRIDNISLALESSTYIRFKSILPSNRKTKFEIKLLDRQPVDYTFDSKKPIKFEDSSENETESLSEKKLPTGVDLSKLPGAVAVLSSAKLGKQIEKPLTPTFNTYIIAREYTLSWKLELEIVGEKVRVANTQKLRFRVLPPLAHDLETILKDADATQAEIAEDEGYQEDSDAGTAEVTNEKSPNAFLKKIGTRKTKQEEAAEDAAAEGGSASASNLPLQYHQDEILPSYEPNPSNFGYRDEIDDNPPGYEAE